MTLRAMARHLGLSATAVSLALKDSTRISAEVRRRVQDLAAAHGYVPNARLSELMREVRASATPGYRATLGAFSLYPYAEPWKEKNWAFLGEALAGATLRAQTHGYRLDYFWLKQPGFSAARLRTVLKARAIEGLFCLGSLDPEEEMPPELGEFAIVTYATSIPSPLHRVASHFARDARTLFEEVRRRGYRRPGLVIALHGDRRTDYAYSSTYLGIWDRRLQPPPIPVLRTDVWDEAAFDRWLTEHRPDVVVLHQLPHYLEQVRRHLRQRGLRVPGDIGIALLDLNPDVTTYSGICQDPRLMGATAIEMLIGRVLLRDFGQPLHPKVELVLGAWNEGRTLRSAVETEPAGRTQPV
ncbi:MAG: LacI family DNA-binding transcriptional regulator [Opitutaceae bacterium]|nr:LacI family DNA-binding transcriptional regulator [Opitutaceae bacterium]